MADSFIRYMSVNPRVDYLKNVLGIKSVMLPKNFEKSTTSLTPTPIEVAFQTRGNGPVLFLGQFQKQTEAAFAIDELQLLEKIIVALKLRFEATCIAKVAQVTPENLFQFLNENQFSYVIVLGNSFDHILPETKLNEEVVINNIKLLNTFHPREMIDNPDLKKDAWVGFKKIMENLPR